jgi:archaellum biogenesis ATPase FlaH
MNFIAQLSESMAISEPYGWFGDMGNMVRQLKKWQREKEKRLSLLCNMRLGRAKIFPHSMRTCATYVDQTQMTVHTVQIVSESIEVKSCNHTSSPTSLSKQRVRVKWLPAVALVQSLQQAKRDLDLMTAMTRLDKYQVLVIDDIGYVKKNDAETQVLFEFIAHRYESGSLIITSNQPFSHWDQIFSDTMMTVAAIDRIIHHATIIEIEGDSYRRKQSLKN